MHAVRWQGHGSLRLENAFTLVLDSYGGTVDDFVPVGTGSSTSCLIEDEDHWILCNIWLSRIADAHPTLCVNFLDLQSQCNDLGLAVPGEAGTTFRLAL